MATHHGHLLQSWAWGELKSRFGWTALRLYVGEGAAQILFRRLPLGLTLAYIPKGPVVNWEDNEQAHALFAAIHAEAKKRQAILLKVEPNLNLGATHPLRESALHLDPVNFLTQAGFHPADTIQPRTSLVIDLNGDEAALLAAMKQKTRYNIRLAEKKGITVRQGSAAHVAIFHQLALITASRDSFGVHSLDYYQAAYTLFAPDRCALLMAEFEGQPLAALMVFRQGQKAYYFYGASSNEYRNLMAPYLLQWAAIRWAKNQGCTHYDLWGIPDADLASLEAEFERRNDGLWGVYRFKRGFGGQWLQSVGAYDYVYNPLLYQIYRLRRKQ
ncbi:MAG TPA: peptidoglycan bridge formation glycyltransferase FemA/FemB family protein [Anaerolineae bacterium]|nr:peptidoglycan bridge formation glycyltransferase FemA/FemB family protein [Anaerolineae bacterium]